MSRTLSPICLVGFAVLLLAACSSQRASERACRKADKHIAKAVWLCPDVLRHDSATVTFTLPGDSAATTAAFTDPIVDSLLKACEDFALAIVHERDSLANALIIHGTGQAEDGSRVNGFGVRPGVSPAPTVPAATARMREQLCYFEPIEANTDVCYARVRPGPNGPLLTLEQKPYKAVATAPCPPQVGRPPCPACNGVAAWWRVASIVLALLLIGRYVLGKVNAGLINLRSQIR